jgi:hypothetical protein
MKNLLGICEHQWMEMGIFYHPWALSMQTSFIFIAKKPLLKLIKLGCAICIDK